MLTYEDITDCFLKAATRVGLTTHPEYWANSRTMEREFACACHTGNCEDAEKASTCTLSFTWTTLDTVLSLEGLKGICDFFHQPQQHCPHVHAHEIPPLVLDLSYNIPLDGAPISESTLLSLTKMLKLRASEHSIRGIETRPGISLTLEDNRLQPEALTLQQHVELPIWHPLGMQGLLGGYPDSDLFPPDWPRPFKRNEEDDDEVIFDEPQPEEWLPAIIADVCQDILQVMKALEAARSSRPLQMDL